MGRTIGLSFVRVGRACELAADFLSGRLLGGQSRGPASRTGKDNKLLQLAHLHRALSPGPAMQTLRSVASKVCSSAP